MQTITFNVGTVRVTDAVVRGAHIASIYERRGIGSPFPRQGDCLAVPDASRSISNVLGHALMQHAIRSGNFAEHWTISHA